MQITKREKKMLIAVGIVLIISGIYYFMYKPILDEVEYLFAQIDGEQLRILDLVAMAEVNNSINEEITLIQGEIEDTLKELPEISDEPGLVKHLHHMFVPFGGLRSIHIEDPVSGGEFSGVGVRLTYDLDYEEFHTILLALEGSPYKNRIDSFALQRTQGDNANEIQSVTVDMALTFYFSN